MGEGPFLFNILFLPFGPSYITSQPPPPPARVTPRSSSWLQSANAFDGNSLGGLSGALPLVTLVITRTVTILDCLSGRVGYASVGSEFEGSQRGVQRNVERGLDVRASRGI